MTPDYAFLLGVALAGIGALALGFWLDQSYRRSLAEIRADRLSDANRWADQVAALGEQVHKADRRALVAEATVEALANELATSHRANMLLRTGILDAEREVMQMAKVLDLPMRTDRPSA